MIVLSEKNYHTLRELGTVTDSFDDVVTKILAVAAPVLRKTKKLPQESDKVAAQEDSG